MHTSCCNGSKRALVHRRTLSSDVPRASLARHDTRPSSPAAAEKSKPHRSARGLSEGRARLRLYGGGAPAEIYVAGPAISRNSFPFARTAARHFPAARRKRGRRAFRPRGSENAPARDRPCRGRNQPPRLRRTAWRIERGGCCGGFLAMSRGQCGIDGAVRNL